MIKFNNNYYLNEMIWTCGLQARAKLRRAVA